MNHVITAFVGSLALYAVSSNGLAAEAGTHAPQEIVKFGDLDLTRSAGAQELYRRITRAARDVCATATPGRFPVATAHRGCTDQAIARAVATVDNPLLTERYEQKSHRQILQPQQVGLNR
jgi:UrcA family protein